MYVLLIVRSARCTHRRPAASFAHKHRSGPGTLLLPLLLLRALCAMSKEQEKQLNKVVSTLLRQLYEMETMAADFTQPTSQQLLTTRMQEFSQGLEQFRQLAGAYSSTQVPTALLKFIDDGGHPDDFVRNTFRAAVGDNQLAAGRVAAVQAMQQELAQAAAAAFPAEANTYNDVVVKKQAAMQQQDAQHQQQEQQPAASQQPPAPS